jgi:hypothetical protein
MKYKTGAAFRRALEERLRNQAIQSQVPLVRLRKLVAFDRFLARLVVDQPGQWILKGGLALQLRIGSRARTTKDIDLLSLSSVENLGQLLSMAGRIDLGDWFTFEINNQPDPLPEETHGARYSVRSILDSRAFELFHVDIGIGDPVTSPADILTTPPILAFAEISPTLIPCYPLTQHLAEKVHAYTRQHPSGESSRVKDLVDILLIIQDNRIEAGLLGQSIQETFAVRKTHPLPVELPEPPPEWVQPYRKFAAEVGLRSSDLQTGFVEASHFINPILSGRDSGIWHPEDQAWE